MASSEVDPGRFVQRTVEDIFMTQKFKSVDIHDGEQKLLAIAENCTDKCEISIRADKNIEFIGFELYLGEEDEVPPNQKGKRFMQTADFKIYETETGETVETLACQLSCQFNSKRLGLPIPFTVMFEAKKWYTVSFELKGPRFGYGTGMKMANAVNIESAGQINFDFKNGKNISKLASVMFEPLPDKIGKPLATDRNPGFNSNPSCTYTAERYDSVGFRRLDRQDNGTVTFKASQTILLQGLRFFGMKPQIGGIPNAMAVHSAHFSVVDVATNSEIHSTDYMVLTSTAEQSSFCVPVKGSGGVVLMADADYQVKFTIRGPKLRFGLDPRDSVTMNDDCCCRTCQLDRSVTFTFLDARRSEQLLGLDFAFVDVEMKISSAGEEKTD